ncbi:B3/4 domain-containing protein [Shimwellia pseudoproteus]|uniref:B3/B4 domain-containing protein n=1 Tax=Shimwellia pseudoproteus TaxID=570012 RepID=UPI0018EDD1C5|nr:B3/4 domain-containing protein [Shimwellia pseudoproteus]MBJ3814932.1 B3/4 domain-containing protein [Shimwellia pseudoproteus]
MLCFSPSIDDAVSRIAPHFRALSILVDNARVSRPDIGRDMLAQACQGALEGQPDWAAAHIDAWNETYRAFGAKPKRTPCSADALIKRVLRDGAIPPIDPVVDLYNAISIRYALPVGGENIAAYCGQPRLTVARGDEPFDVMKDGEPVIEHPDAGEVIWRDDRGVTCRRWNWRQGVRTRLSADNTAMWFVLESLPAMPLEALYQAGETLTNGLAHMMPAASITMQPFGHFPEEPAQD